MDQGPYREGKEVEPKQTYLVWLLVTWLPPIARWLRRLFLLSVFAVIAVSLSIIFHAYQDTRDLIRRWRTPEMSASVNDYLHDPGCHK